MYGSEDGAGEGEAGICEAVAGWESLGARRGSVGTVPRGVLVEGADDPVERALAEVSFPLTLKGLGAWEGVPGSLWDGSGVGTRTGNPPL